MAEIPSHITSSAAQSQIQARESTKEREAQQANQAHATKREVKAIDDTAAIVETDDADNRVFTDSEGQGGQGKPFDDKEEDRPESTEKTEGIRKDDDGTLHVDIEA